MGTERRRAERIPIGLEIAFDSGTGLSRDFSGLGVYFETDSGGFRKHDELRFKMVIPDAVDVACVGRIVRIDELADGRFGIACTIDAFELSDEPSQAASAHLVIRELRAHH